MKVPAYQPRVTRSTGNGSPLMYSGSFDSGLRPQGCNLIRCASAVARCVANPNPVQCILDIAPNCLDCIPH
jgi:hypothetical protein